ALAPVRRAHALREAAPLPGCWVRGRSMPRPLITNASARQAGGDLTTARRWRRSAEGDGPIPRPFLGAGRPDAGPTSRRERRLVGAPSPTDRLSIFCWRTRGHPSAAATPFVRPRP